MSSRLEVIGIAAAAVAVGYALLKKKRSVTPGGPLFAAAQSDGTVIYVSGQLGLVPGVTPLKLADGFEAQCHAS
jgi:enamine deaminase RidA (YjgF/YER057c/UK114 family)